MSVASSSRFDANNWIVLRSSTVPRALTEYESIEVDGLVFARCPDGRFAQDKCLATVGDWVLLFEGVLLNKSELLTSTEADSIEQVLVYLLETHGIETALAQLRGPFSGAFLDRRSGAVHFFANQTGDTAAYIYDDGSVGERMASNSFDLIARLTKASGRSLSFNERAARMMLSYGFMTDECTFANEVQRVLPGTVETVHFTPGGTKRQMRRYWKLQHAERTDLTLGASVDLIEAGFRAAVQRCFEKDLEYGFETHLADISGGLDSRVLNHTAKDLGYSPIVNICYGQSGSDEVKFAQRVSQSLGHSCIYLLLDTGNCLSDPDSVLRLNGGAAYYAGITGGHEALESLNFKRFGLEHTGQLGDVVIGTFSQGTEHSAPRQSGELYSKLHSYADNVDLSAWSTHEEYAMNTRGFLGAVSTHLLRRHYTYAVSPFIDVDLIDTAFSIPLRFRYGHTLYQAWLKKYHRGALKVMRTRRLPMDRSPVRLVAHNARKVFLRARFELVRGLSRVGLPLTVNAPNNMNPFDFWHATNPSLRDRLESLFNRRTPISSDLDQDLQTSFLSGNTTEKLLAISVVAMHELYFSNVE